MPILAPKGRAAEYKALQSLITAGHFMSNTCFNLSQLAGKQISADNAASMRDAQQGWDEALRKYREITKGKSTNGRAR